MKPHDPTSTPASSASHPEAVRGGDAQVCLPLWAARIAYVEIFAVMDRLYWRLPPAGNGDEATEGETRRYGNLQRLHEQLTVAVGFHNAASLDEGVMRPQDYQKDYEKVLMLLTQISDASAAHDQANPCTLLQVMGSVWQQLLRHLSWLFQTLKIRQEKIS